MVFSRRGTGRRSRPIQSRDFYAEGKGVRQDWPKARQWFEAAAQQGVSAAYVNLGWMCEQGLGAVRDYAAAAAYYHKAADLGDDRAQFNLGCMHIAGRGVSENYEEAYRWFKQAALQGNASAQFNLAILYEMGNGTHQDFTEAYIWYSMAAAKGNAEAAEKRDQLALLLTKEQLSEAQTRTAGISAQAASSSDAQSNPS